MQVFLLWGLSHRDPQDQPVRVLILKMKTLKLGEVNWLTPGHTVTAGGTHAWNPLTLWVLSTHCDATTYSSPWLWPHYLNLHSSLVRSILSFPLYRWRRWGTNYSLGSCPKPYINCYRLSGFNNRNLYFCGSGGLKSKIKDAAEVGFLGRFLFLACR